MKRKQPLLLVIIAFFVLSNFIYNVPNIEAATKLDIKAKAAIIIDAKTGKVLYEDNADELLGVASMSKMLTEYLVLEAIHEGRISWDQKVTINEFVHKLSSPYLGLSNVGLTQGEAYTVKELYQAMAIHSANAATVALAEVIAGTEGNFVKLMNEKAAELELGDFHFVNSTGLNNSDMLDNHPEGTDINDENKMSARATAKLAYHLLNDFPEVLDTAKISRLKFRDGRTYNNFNWMLPELTFEYEGVDGLKTGSTNFAGYCFTATAVKSNQRFITVIMNTKSQIERFNETAKLLDYAFANFGEDTLFEKGFVPESKKTLPVTKGKDDSVKIATKDPLSLIIKNGEKDKYKAKLVLNKKKLNEDGQLTAPVKEGDVVGYLTYEYDGDDLGFITDKESTVKVDVVATESVEKANWFVLMMRGIGNFFASLWNGITTTVGGWF
ncbi:serine hydrolase [Bacillus kwashiorkori]|uniref:serine hydrolase n=1 Tax=Bacillus kwashiorkori TaxID=1522318 RepID=UPI0007851667|nr:serine hydrolase [Bacillus kwashiorkori]